MKDLFIHTILRQAGTTTELMQNQHEFIISDESRDSYDTVFKVSGWDLSRRESGKRKVTYGHPSATNLDPDVIIGVGHERIEGDKLISLLTLEHDTGNRIAETVNKKLKFGSLTDASIRAHIIDGRMGEERLGEDPKLFYFTRQILADWGVVSDGSNENAVKTRSALADWIKTKVPTNRYRDLDIARAVSTRYYTML